MHNDLLEADSTLTVGTHHAEASILSRKAELRDLRGHVEALAGQVVEVEQLIATTRESIATLKPSSSGQKLELDVLTEQVNDLRMRIGQHRQQRAGLHEEACVGQSELVGLEVDIQVQKRHGNRLRLKQKERRNWWRHWKAG